MQDVLLVFDIGKTNKKYYLYSLQLKLIESKSVQFPEIGSHGCLCDDIISIRQWVFASIKKSARKYKIATVAFSTHGAAVVFLDKAGEPVLPLFSYTREIEKEIEQDFLQLMGGPCELQQKTGTCNLPNLLNMAKMIYWAGRKYPEEFKKCYRILSYPSYFGYLLTGIMSAEATFLGCHTYLFDFRTGDWSYVKEKLFSVDKMPFRIGYPQDRLGFITEDVFRKYCTSNRALVTYGIHDSNAAIIPFILHKQDKFILHSTGTWCVNMKLHDRASFDKREIGKNVFFNQSAIGKPIKTVIFMGGYDFEQVHTILRIESHKTIFSTTNLLRYVQMVCKEKELFFIPGLITGTTLFQQQPCGFLWHDDLIPVGSFREVMLKECIPVENVQAALILTILYEAMAGFRIIGVKKNDSIFIEGGFKNNVLYCRLLQLLHPEQQVFVSNIKNASALGAAITALSAYEQNQPGEPDYWNDEWNVRQESPVLENPVDLHSIKKYMEFLRQRLFP